VTFAAITLIGGLMVVRRAAGRTHSHGHLHAVDHPHAEGRAPTDGLTLRSLIGIAVPAGVIPCPGAVAVILFALSLHMFALSVLAVSSISLGMGTTISATGAIVILAKRGAIRVAAGSRDERESRVRRIIEIAGAAVLFLFGLVFFLAQL